MNRKDNQTETGMDQAVPTDMAAISEEEISPDSQPAADSTAGGEKAPGLQVDAAEEPPFPQTDPESDGIPVAKEAEGAHNSSDSQTEPETAGDEQSEPGDHADAGANPTAHQTDSETDADEQLGAPDLADPEANSADTQTDSENTPDDDGGSSAVPYTPDKPQTKKKATRKRSTAVKTGESKRRSVNKKSESDTADENLAESDEGDPVLSQSDSGAAEPPKPASRQSRTARRSMRRNEPVVSIDEERTVQTTADKLQSDLLDLVESMKSRKVLTGTIQGVERPEDNPNLSFAVIYHGEFKVIIPAEETVEPPADFRDRLPGDVMHYLVTKRLGAEVDFIVKGVDPKTGIAAASRLEAMAAKRKEYYFGTDRDGNNLLYEGISAEARIVSVIRAGIFVDLFGLETYIPLRELSYQRWVDAGNHYQAGQRVLVKVLGIDRSSRSDIKVSVSVKQAGENPYEKALRRYNVGSRYVGTVSMVDTNGVFVSLDGGIDCLCSYPKRGRPPRGSRVTVRILGINHESNRIWGAITHMTTR